MTEPTEQPKSKVYVVVTRPKSEGIVVAALQAAGFSAYSPMEVHWLSCLTGRRWARDRKVASPLFNRLVFVALPGPMTEEEYQVIRHARRVTDVLGWAREARAGPAGQRVTVFDPQAFVFELICRELAGEFDQTLKARRRLKVGALVKVIRGIWKDQVGTLTAMDDETGLGRVVFDGRHVRGDLPFEEDDLAEEAAPSAQNAA